MQIGSWLRKWLSEDGQLEHEHRKKLKGHYFNNCYIRSHLIFLRWCGIFCKNPCEEPRSYLSLGQVWTPQPYFPAIELLTPAYKLHTRRIKYKYGLLERFSVWGFGNQSLLYSWFCFFFPLQKFKATKLASKKFSKVLSEAMMKYSYIKPDAK